MDTNSLVEERLDQYNKYRKEVRSQLQETCSKMLAEAEALEESINREILIALVGEKKALSTSLEWLKSKK